MTQKKPSEKTPLEDQLTDNPFVHWVATNGSVLVYAIIVVALFSVAAIRFGWFSSSEGSTPYLTTANQYSRFSLSPSSQTGKNALSELKNLLQTYPELQARYDGEIAQALILNHEPSEAELFLTRALQRTNNLQLPLYAEFSKVTLLIAEENYQEALKKALLLKAKLRQDDLQNTLFSYTELAIAALSKKLGKENSFDQVNLSLENFY